MIPGVVLACFAISASVEIAAHVLKLWVFRAPWIGVANWIVASTLFGTISSLVVGEPIQARFLVGAMVGVGLEAANAFGPELWTFPDERVLFLKGKPAIVVAMGLGWGALPALAPILAGV